ncbi:MAG: T9SS type A sorting domain-containing protein [Saprospiraceae bacterium]|nr:T9SS type A sorting domain-containing protein [Saprospiraceae bacterium]
MKKFIFAPPPAGRWITGALYLTKCFFVFLISATTSLPILAQQGAYYECPESYGATFSGIPEQTLCELYPNFNCQTQIGAGTQFSKSSLLGTSISGNVCIVGDFEVDANFTFLNALVKINPGVKIIVAESPNGYSGGSTLGINNSKMFACNSLWKGITLGFLSVIATSNNSVIEDAEKAIFANVPAGLYIQKTTFNRNRVGIELEGPSASILAVGPRVLNFSANRFMCDAPLNGTVDEITEAGVKLKNAALYAFQAGINGMNRFFNLSYGIKAEGNSFVGLSQIYMQGIKKTGIYMIKGFIQINHSWFYQLEGYGIHIDRAVFVDIKNTKFKVSSNSPLWRFGIFIYYFEVNSDVTISNISFEADLDGTENKVRGVFLVGSVVGAGTKIRVEGSTFAIRTGSSYGISVAGDFPSSSTIEIWNNQFRISTSILANGAPIGTVARPTGLSVSGHNVNNVSIKWNTFTSYAFFEYPPGVIGITQFNVGLDLSMNTSGTGNEVSVNAFNYEVQSLQNGLQVNNFQNTKYCSNTFSGLGVSKGVDFVGTCTGTDFTGNVFNYASMYPNIDGGLSMGLNFRENAIIGPQLHKGNEWHNLFGVEPGIHARCQGNLLLNKFTVHTPQSTCADETFPCFSEYHPRKIQPDDMDEFFDIDPFGIPSPGCNDGLTNPGGTDELDRIIAQGEFIPPGDDPSLSWVLQRFLYQKLKKHPNFVVEHASFSPFMSAHANSSVGKFYEVHQSIESALKAEPAIDIHSKQALADISALVDSIVNIDEAIGQEGATEALVQIKEDLMDQIHNLHWAYDSLNSVYNTQVIANLQNAYNQNEAIPVLQNYEVNEKTVNQIYLLSMMQQGGKLTLNQVAILEAIAQQDPKTGGPAVHAASLLLPDCNGLNTQYAIPNSGILPEYAQLSEDIKANDLLSNHSNKISVFPNPANSSFTIRNLNGTDGTLFLADMTGKVWAQYPTFGEETQIDIEANIPSGVYLLRVVMDDGTLFVEKLIIQRK